MAKPVLYGQCPLMLGGLLTFLAAQPAAAGDLGDQIERLYLLPDVEIAASRSAKLEVVRDHERLNIADQIAVNDVEADHWVQPQLVIRF